MYMELIHDSCPFALYLQIPLPGQPCNRRWWKAAGGRADFIVELDRKAEKRLEIGRPRRALMPLSPDPQCRQKDIKSGHK